MPKGFFDRSPTIHGHAQMMERLAQRTKGKVMAGGQANTETEDSPRLLGESSGSDRLPPLEWLPPIKGMEAIITACGRYSVARARVNGVASYQAWLRLPSPAMLGEPQDNAEKAKHIAEAHFNG